jgi:hypothetical protein
MARGYAGLGGKLFPGIATATLAVLSCLFRLGDVRAEDSPLPAFVPSEQAEQTLALAGDKAFLPIERDIVAGNFPRARATLAQVLNEDPTSIEALFLLAEVERRSGNLDAAISIYRGVLARHPSLDRIRLELAVTLISARKDADAEREFYSVLRNVPPGLVSARIRNTLGAIEQRKSFLWDLGISLAGDSNINAAPRDRTVTIFGLPFVLSDESRKRSGLGVDLSAAGEWRPQLSSDLRLRLGANVFDIDYQGGRFDNQGADGHVGIQFFYPRWNASLLAVGSVRYYGGDPYSSSYGARIESAWSPAERIALQLSTDVQYASYSALGAVDGIQWSVGAIPVYAFRPNLALWLNLAFGARASRSPVFAYESERAGLGGRIDTDWGVTISAEADAIFYQYRAPNPFFGRSESDMLAWGYVALAFPRFAVLGLNPRLAVTYSNNFSNIPIARYERTNFEFSFVRRY